MPDVVIRTRVLSKAYGSRRGVDSIDLIVSAGEIFGFLGPNGAGKTTTIRLLLGFLRPSAGGASIFGFDCWGASHRIKRDVGYLPSDLRLYPWMTVGNALRLSGASRGQDLRKRGLALAEQFEIDPSVPARKMSHGMRQKVGVIFALAHEPKLLILDEPTSGLDPLMQHELSQLLRECAAAGSTVFFSSHSLAEVEELCDRVAIVREGRLVADETLRTLRGKATREVKIVFENASAATNTTSPDFLRVLGRRADHWRCELEGSAKALVRWAAGLPIRDLSIGEPDLESVFRRYYGDKGEPQ